jgi:hypothetical protein
VFRNRSITASIACDMPSPRVFVSLRLEQPAVVRDERVISSAEDERFLPGIQPMLVGAARKFDSDSPENGEASGSRSHLWVVFSFC